jgi:ELWxxDGT repeat protein
LVGDLRAGALGSSITELVAGPRAVFFVADDGVAGAELWRSDGTDGGTFRVADLAPGPTSSFPRGLQVLGDGVAFTAAPSLGAGQRLCVSDGSDKGTRCPLSSGPGATGSFPLVVAAAGPAALFTAVAPALGRGLYALLPDGGVERLAARAVLEAAQTSDTAFLALVADGGVELWASDGTATGTRTLGAFSTLGNLRAVGTQLYFSANGDAGSGTELWRSDGTAAGTLLAAELAPDALSSSPGPVEWVGNALLVAARGETFDVEPFRVALPQQVDNTGPAIAAVLEGPQRDGGWFVGDVAVRFEVTDPGSAVQAREGCDPQVVTADTRGLTLTCAATSAGGQSRLSVTLRRDATAPQLRCPDPGALTSPDGGAVAFAFSVSATDAIDPNPTVTVKAPASGKFQVGVTEVSATAQDEAGNSSSCAFEVRVASPGVTEEPAPRPSPAGCGCGASPSGLGALALLLLALRSLSARRQGASTRP